MKKEPIRKEDTEKEIPNSIWILCTIGLLEHTIHSQPAFIMPSSSIVD
jgi:hypothetical protein